MKIYDIEKDVTVNDIKGKFRYANKLGWTDVEPHRVISVSPSGKTLEIEKMKTELVADWKPEYVPGGFSAHCTNQNEQRWSISSDKYGYRQKIRLHKDGFFYNATGAKFCLSDRPIKYYDYNF